jgi:TRAP-type C4-dicarboxylate transport system substrate-binding protein
MRESSAAIRRRSLVLGGAAAASIVSTARAQQKVEATLASVNSAEYLNPRMQMLFADKVRQKTNGQVDIKWVGSGSSAA